MARSWASFGASSRVAAGGSWIAFLVFMIVAETAMNGRTAMDISHAETHIHRKVPPIDAAVPVKTETATFGLG